MVAVMKSFLIVLSTHLYFESPVCIVKTLDHKGEYALQP